jgi:proteic killer suppression protein
MIRSFKNADTAALFDGKRVPRLQAVESVAVRKLRQLHLARDLMRDLGAPPGNRLKLLGGERKAQWSIRINDQWRLCFEWRDGEAYEVEIVDYH